MNVKPNLPRPPRYRCLLAIVAAVAVFLSIVPATAQEAPPSLEFSFSNPGARSMGLGGAFVALADDATAAFSNPAGLVQLLKPEISLELRKRDYSTPFTAGGRASGAATGYGIDTVDDIRNATSEESTSGLSFLSFVYPGDRWSLAIYRHQLAGFAINTQLNGLFGDAEGGGTRRYLDGFSSTDVDIVNNGVSAALEVSESLSFGVGISYFVGSINMASENYLVDQYPETFWDPNSFLPERQFENAQFESDATDLGINFGFLWRFTENWRLGGVYRQGPSLDYTILNRAGPAHWEAEGSILGSVSDRSISIPDVWGVGVSYRSPGGSLTVGFEWDYVEYSVILESLASGQVDITDVRLDDANELRLGVEYVFLETNPLMAVRGGVWLDPDHRFHYVGNDPFEQALFPPGDDALHFSIGVGVAFKGFQIDLGMDLSDAVDVFSLSAIYSF